MKVLNFGSMNIDNVYYLDDFVQPGETKNVDRLEVNPGGKGLNQSISMSRAGIKVCHAGLYGTGGDNLKDYLEENKVDVKYVTPTTEIQGHAVIQVDGDGENCIMVYSGSNSKITKDYIDSVLKDFDQNTILVIQNEVSEIEYLIDKGKEKNMVIVLNPSPLAQILIDMDYGKIDWLILNKIEGMAISKKDTVETVMEYFKETFPKLNVVLTLGAEGSICLYSGDVFVQKGIKSNAIDTTGAGDTYTGYFISGISRNKDITQVLMEATIASSICVSRKGAAPSIPTYKEVEEIYKRSL